MYISGFLIGAALVCQPHILTKPLYLKSDRAVKKYLFYSVVILILFFLLPTAGFYARLTVPAEKFIDPSTQAFRQDLVMTVYLKETFPGWMFTLIGIVLLAAGMSTLDGILVALSTILANDLVLNLLDRFGRRREPQERLRLAYRLSHILLLAIAVVAFLICLHPPRLLGIFGQVGVYGMAVAAVPPLLGGVLFRKMPLWLVWGASAVGLALHFLLYFFGAGWFPGSGLTFANPGVPASLAILLSAAPALAIGWLLQRTAAAPTPAK